MSLPAGRHGLPHLTEEEQPRRCTACNGVGRLVVKVPEGGAYTKPCPGQCDHGQHYLSGAHLLRELSEARGLLKEIVGQLATSTADTCMNCQAPVQECTCEDFGPARAYLKERGLT